MSQIYRIMKNEQYQPYMVERYILMFGEEKTLELLRSFQKPPVPSINVNTCNISIKALKERLEAKHFHLEPVPWCSTGFWIYDAHEYEKKMNPGMVSQFQFSPGATHEYLQGMYSMQGASSMLPPVLLDPKPDDDVLDMAAAPGTKFVQMGQMMKNRGVLVGVERSLDRVPALKANVQRCGVTNSILICNDSRHIGEQFNGFGKILLDAPCTGEGLIGSDPTRKNSRSVGDIQTMRDIQVQLLENAVALLKPSGRMVYSTCSLAPEENEFVIDKVIQNHKNLAVVEPPKEIAKHFDQGLVQTMGAKFDPSLKNAIRVYPYHHPTRPEGFFAAIIEKMEKI
nr:RsmB/NOP family class I SAM-dependent RNA methyltransferase [Candidatus Sigynarchaeota archaeon]